MTSLVETNLSYSLSLVQLYPHGLKVHRLLDDLVVLRELLPPHGLQEGPGIVLLLHLVQEVFADALVVFGDTFPPTVGRVDLTILGDVLEY